MVDFEWYRSFVYIYKYNSVSQAAKTRIMTQPAMSQHLASLEAEVGEPLFIRTARKMIPTERGKELYSQLAPLIESLEETSLGFHAASLPTPPRSALDRQLNTIQRKYSRSYLALRPIPFPPLELPTSCSCC
ncbi:helix-turn-helix domain-containing protein [Paenibacillus stellifer]|uniref:helix-turn-helix domain-containing protein n=1 Tax=Paenibacillus stellifer TaxID=169760 RepID=UPI0006920FFC|nr:LysR family transcriptional regulator [Paenibacillus stellifer]